MRKTLLAALAASVFLASCVTSSDLRRIEDAQSAYRVDVQRTVDELRAEAITEKQADERIEEAQRTLSEEIDATARAVEERTTAIAKAAGHIPTDPMSLLTYVAGLGAAVAGSTRLAEKRVNEKRDIARRLRGEPTGGASS
jgi:hypothetical protein